MRTFYGEYFRPSDRFAKTHDAKENDVKYSFNGWTTKNMPYADVKIMFNGELYDAVNSSYVDGPGEIPRVEASTSICPANRFGAYKNLDTDHASLSIKNVIFNPPATIVFWSDNTKTVVKCDYKYESYDPEKGIAMAISKKLYGDNKPKYYNDFRHWIKKYEKQQKKEEK